MSMGIGKAAAETHYYCRSIAKERDTYRDLCAELFDSLKEYMGAVELMSAAMKDGINVHGAISGLIGAEEMAFQSITKAQSILGEGQ